MQRNKKDKCLSGNKLNFAVLPAANMPFRYIGVCILLFLSPLLALDNEAHKLFKTKIAPGIVVSLPAALKPVSVEEAARRSPSVRNPLATYATEDRTVDFNAHISATQWPDADTQLAHDFFKASIYNLYDKVDIISEGVRKLRRKNYVYVEFISTVRGDINRSPVLRYTYTQYLIESDRTLAFTFSCTRSLASSWTPTAHAVMNSIRVR